MRDRTADLFRAREALSQLSYSPIILSVETRGVQVAHERFDNEEQARFGRPGQI